MFNSKTYVVQESSCLFHGSLAGTSGLGLMGIVRRLGGIAILGSRCTRWVLSILQWQVNRAALEGEGGVTSILVILGLGIAENHRTLQLSKDIPLGVLDVLEEENELAATVLLDEIMDLGTVATHDDHEVVLTRGGDIAFLRS